MDTKVDVLNLEWRSEPGRDRIISSLVCNYLRYLGFKVQEGSIFKGFELIDKLNPKVLFLSNSIGAPINNAVIKYAASKGIICISGFSEGNFRENDISQFIWGHNQDDNFYESRLLVWSEKKKELALKHFGNQLGEKLAISGGIGFDLYKINEKKNGRDLFLRKYKKAEFENVIGFGCFDFGIFNPSDTRFERENRNRPKGEFLYFLEDRKLLNELLHKLILSNQKTLFLLKQHPGVELGFWASAIEDLESFSNVLILKNEESIYDCIDVSDFWISYESTTALEAWLLGKQTCLLNPQGGDFTRDQIYLGSPIFSTFEEIQNVIKKFYSTGELLGFKERTILRTELIKDTIQWDDGFNHVRAGNIIVGLLEMDKNSEKSFNLDFQFKFYVFKQRVYSIVINIINSYFKIFKKNKRIHMAIDLREFNDMRMKAFSEKLFCEQIDFYSKSNKSVQDLRCILCM